MRLPWDPRCDALFPFVSNSPFWYNPRSWLLVDPVNWSQSRAVSVERHLESHRAVSPSANSWVFSICFFPGGTLRQSRSVCGQPTPVGLSLPLLG